MLKSVQEHICAVKINHHLILPFGTFGGIQELLRKIHRQQLVAIMDCKANDIGATNRVIAEYYYSAGFDALIANPFVGWEEGLEPIFEAASRHKKGVILLAYMSHKGAKEGYDQTISDSKTGRQLKQYCSFARKALSWNADGVVVGATYPEKIKEIHQILGEKTPIYSPGIGTQGGKIKTALEAGAKYLILGRVITTSEDPDKTAKELNKKIRNAIKIGVA